MTGLIAVVIVATGLSAAAGWPGGRCAGSPSSLGVVAGVAVVGAVVAIVQAYGDLRDGERALRAAASALEQGDIPVAVRAARAQR